MSTLRPSPPPYRPISPISVSERWFPPGKSYGLYRHENQVAPNVTSILSHFFPFDLDAWKRVEPDIDHEKVSREAARRGTAVHQAMEDWLAGKNSQNGRTVDFAKWIDPLQELVSKATATLGVEIPVFVSLENGISYAGSCDALMKVKDSVVIIDYKTKRENKRVSPKYLLKQKLQMAAYSIGIDVLYGEQIGSCVHRASLLFAHPDPGRKPTVVTIGRQELLQLQQQWIGMLCEWHQIYMRESCA